jgi:hypothetical protein
MAIPTKDTLLVPYSTNWNTRITATPSAFNLLPAQATAYTALHDPYLAAFAAMSVLGSRSQSLVSAKDAAKASLLFYARELYTFVAASGNVSDANKNLLGVRVRSMPVPIGPPTVKPAVDGVSVNGQLVRVRLHDAAGEGKRTKPAGVKQAAVYSFTGPVAPNDPSLFKWEGVTGKSVFDVLFPSSAVPGTVVWITAQWLNERGQTGPASTPISATIGFGGVMAA